MSEAKDRVTVGISITDGVCPAGEKVGRRNLEEGQIPVLSCEGACIRGEIARLAAHLVAREEGYRRGCHGELFTVPGSAIAEWIIKSEKVVLIDGCFLRCHGRILENLLGKDNLIQFDALSYYRKYAEHFYIDAVPEAERNAAARLVADAVLAELGRTSPAGCGRTTERGCTNAKEYVNAE